MAKAKIVTAPKPKAPNTKLTKVTMEVAKLKPAPYNARVALKAGDAEYEGIRQSLLQYGLVEPLVYSSRRKYVFGGAQRLQVLKDLKVKEVDVIVMDIADLKREKALSLALNKVGGKWDPDKLRRMLSDGVFDEDVDLFTGFSVEEVEALGLQDDPPPEDDDEEPGTPEGGPDETTVYQLVVDCDSPTHQETLKRRLEAQGLTVRAVTI